MTIYSVKTIRPFVLDMYLRNIRSTNASAAYLPRTWEGKGLYIYKFSSIKCKYSIYLYNRYLYWR